MCFSLYMLQNAIF